MACAHCNMVGHTFDTCRLRKRAELAEKKEKKDSPRPRETHPSCTSCTRGLTHAEAMIGMGKCEECDPAVLWEIQEAAKCQSARSPPKRVILRSAPRREPTSAGESRPRGSVARDPSTAPWRVKQAAEAEAATTRGTRPRSARPPPVPAEPWAREPRARRPRQCPGCPFKPSAWAAQWNELSEKKQAIFKEDCCQKCYDMAVQEETGRERSISEGSHSRSRSRSPSRQVRSSPVVKAEARSRSSSTHAESSNPMQQEIIRQAGINLANKMYHEMVKKEE